MEEYHDRLAISTPESVDVVLVLGGPGTRIAAGTIDVLLKLVVGIAGAAVVYGLRDSLGDAWTTAIASVGVFLLLFFYDVAWELLNDGRTPGKAMLGLRVVRDDGRRIDLGSSALRNLLRLIELPLLYAPGIVLVALTSRHQRVGDMVGGTLVVREPRRARSALGLRRRGTGTSSPSAAGSSAPGSAADGEPRARRGPLLDTVRLTDHDRSTARAYAARHRTLDPAERVALARAIGTGLRARVGAVPPEASDEALILEIARGTSLRG